MHRLCIDCSRPTSGTRCLACARVARRRAGTATERGYDAAWRRVRLSVLERDAYRCRIGLRGCTRVATTVDHVIPLAAGGARLELTNLQAACRRCNAGKGGRLIPSVH